MPSLLLSRRQVSSRSTLRSPPPSHCMKLRAKEEPLSLFDSGPLDQGAGAQSNPSRKRQRPNLLQEDEGRPLADRMRPVTLDEFVGQQHILGPDKPLRRQ